MGKIFGISAGDKYYGKNWKREWSKRVLWRGYSDFKWGGPEWSPWGDQSNRRKILPDMRNLSLSFSQNMLYSIPLPIQF